MSSPSTSESVTVIGAGLAGSEAAWQLAVRGIPVNLIEMRPVTPSPAHHTGALAELVCSNSFKSLDPATAPGMLKREMQALGSLIVAAAHATAVPAGAALAVDRDAFAELITRVIEGHPLIALERREATAIPEGDVILATGPLTSSGIEDALSALLGKDRLAFFDAAAPIVSADSVDLSVAFRASRYDKGEGADYINCPLTRESYDAFLEALLSAERVIPKAFEQKDLFQACQPIEEIARCGPDALRFGAMKPVGLIDPATGERPWAVLQLRAENRALTAYNLVGCQTNLTFPEQRRVFSMIPGLRFADFLRYGVMHRNTFVDAPRLLAHDLSVRTDPRVRIAGQLSGTEGYLEAAAGGIVAALGIIDAREGTSSLPLPADTALGSLIAYATDPETVRYQPMHVNIGIMPAMPSVRSKRVRRAAIGDRAAAAIDSYLAANAGMLAPARREAERIIR
ncbi:MAG: methylenetetrahydrofolate--tRNA-(uracil(54)-C(5))-methyltransferase (FADH(2)-oxidizing) TrmFO [Actinobacteria bacterium]|nr:MAG: methylenetetrahydrofolate--tRNA-(uracil(54)-C(5))-methyltransferase (FADH(2)-oxidizing) TrmFO [Actinomycetota bacterium]